MLDSVAALPGGGHVLAEGEAQDIVRRVRDGDPTKGWEGDPTMRVVVQPYQGVSSGRIIYRFEVWALDAQGKAYCALESDTCGPELIDELIRSDTRRRDVFAEAMKAGERAEADKEAALTEHFEQMADKLAFAIQGDNAGHLGGKGRLIPVTKPGG